ncbi:Cyclic di-GMP phosphodiesterase Gmr [Acaryochloris thomasi RCC1774]|uniref:Cyclic di-GMP phosphodiesterase Gmr n=1 Tax=Acaryochloris thomasi RCC1774 TaxID=1764569 RepID=A0A2W1K555_9CYAN|nr:histidine kinase N-terminal 7TM domain-containing protein [Acaryochloris thomasi]PZD75061.1 Cyclic di-GMP phosphodiesterase Gmr [Acaryochloris thomasi RCC1774]
MRFYLLLALVPAIAAFASANAMIFAWQRREIPGARAFSLFAGSVFIWCFFTVFEYLSPAEAARITFGKLQYLGITLLPVAWLIFTLRYTHNDAWLRRKNVVPLFIIPALNLLLAATDPLHGLIWSSTSFVTEPIPALSIEHGLWFNYVMIPYQYSILLTGVGVLLYAYAASSAIYRRQTLILLLATFITFVFNALYIVAGVTPYGLDLTPVGFAISSIMIQFGLFKARFLGLAPVSYRTVFLNTAEAVILLDTRNNIVDLNPPAYRECDETKVLGRAFHDVFPVYNPVLSSRSASEVTQTIKLTRRQRSVLKEVKVRSLRSPGGQQVGSVIIIRDVTFEKTQQEQLKRFAYLDSLTGLFNRRQLEMSAEQALRSSDQWPVTLLYIDLNQFKAINDTYGHAIGDAVLVYVAQCLKACIRDGDIVARLGGDEFVALLSRANQSVAWATRHRLIEKFSQPAHIEGYHLQITASIGIACHPSDGNDLGELLSYADQRMYQDKKAQR